MPPKASSASSPCSTARQRRQPRSRPSRSDITAPISTASLVSIRHQDDAVGRSAQDQPRSASEPRTSSGRPDVAPARSRARLRVGREDHGRRIRCPARSTVSRRRAVGHTRRSFDGACWQHGSRVDLSQSVRCPTASRNSRAQVRTTHWVRRYHIDVAQRSRRAQHRSAHHRHSTIAASSMVRRTPGISCEASEVCRASSASSPCSAASCYADSFAASSACLDDPRRPALVEPADDPR